MGDNQVFNHSFESLRSETGLPDGWQDAGYGDEGTALTSSTEGPASGQRCVRLVNPTYLGTAVGILQSGEHPMHVLPGQRWKASAFFRTDRPGKHLRILVHFWDGAGKWAGWHHLNFVSEGAQMRRYAGLVDIPPGVASVTLHVGMHDTGVAWIDDVAFVQVPKVDIEVLDEPSKRVRGRDTYRRAIAIDARDLLGRSGEVRRYTHSLIDRLTALDSDTLYYLLRSDPPPYGFPDRPNALFAYSGPSPEELWESHMLTQFLVKHGVSLFHNTRSGLDTLHGTPFCPHVVTLHDLAPLKARALFPASLVERVEANLPEYLGRAAAIITSSHRVKEDVMMMFGIPEDRLHVVYAGVGGQFRPLPRDVVRTWLRDRFSLSREYVLCVGNHGPANNICGLVRAYAALPLDIRKAHALVLVGERTARTDEILRLAGELGLSEDVVVTGYVPDQELPYLYCGATALVYPTLYAGLGLAPLEAMACGTPVIASNRSPLPEVAGDASVLIDPEDVEEMRDAIARVTTDAGAREELVRRGFSRAARFTWERCAAKTLAVYARVCGGGS